MFNIPKMLIASFLSLSVASISPGILAGHGGGQGHGQGHGYGHSANANKAHGHQSVSKAVNTNHAVAKNAKATNAVANNAVAKSTARFNVNDRSRIADYVKANPGTVSPSSLPPGIAMNVARGKPLPPGISKVFLPEGVLSKLPAHPGYQYQVVGNDVVLVNSQTGIVSDILTNILR